MLNVDVRVLFNFEFHSGKLVQKLQTLLLIEIFDLLDLLHDEASAFFGVKDKRRSENEFASVGNQPRFENVAFRKTLVDVLFGNDVLFAVKKVFDVDVAVFGFQKLEKRMDRFR